MQNSFLTDSELAEVGFAAIGVGCQISRFAQFYGANRLSLGNYVRIDDFVLISIDSPSIVGNYIHISNSVSIHCSEGFTMQSFVGLSPGSRLFGESDDFVNGNFMHPSLPRELRLLQRSHITLGSYSQVGSNSVLLPGASLGEGTVVGALSLLNSESEDWSVYAGIPAKKIGSRKKFDSSSVKSLET